MDYIGNCRPRQRWKKQRPCGQSGQPSCCRRECPQKYICIGTRIAYVRLKGPVCPLFFVVAYIPHEFRKESPFTHETIEQLETLLNSVSKKDCIVLCGDFNCQLRRNVQGCTGKWSMTKHNEKKGHDQKLINLMRQFDLFAVDTRFKPPRKSWFDGTSRRCNATYLSKHEGNRPTKLDYFLVLNKWQSSVISSETKWGASMERFDTKFDHALLTVRWAWRLRVEKRKPKPDYASMSLQQ